MSAIPLLIVSQRVKTMSLDDTESLVNDSTPPPPASAVDDDHDASLSWVIVEQADTENAAIVAAALLGENQIRARLLTRDGTEPPGSPQRVGLCVWVPPADYDRARFVLWQWAVRRDMPKREGCGKCGSKDIQRGWRFKWHEWALAIILFPALGLMLWDVIFPKNQCRDCGHRWPSRPRCGSSFPVILPDEAKKADA